MAWGVGLTIELNKLKTMIKEEQIDERMTKIEKTQIEQEI